MYNPTIAYHAKSELRGWNEVCRAPADWDGWNQFDRNMIQELLAHGHDTVTIGWNMYQLIREEVTVDIDFAAKYEELASAWAHHLDTPFDVVGRPFELCMQLIEAIWPVYPELIERIEVDPHAFAERVALYRHAMHSLSAEH